MFIFKAIVYMLWFMLIWCLVADSFSCFFSGGTYFVHFSTKCNSKTLTTTNRQCIKNSFACTFVTEFLVHLLSALLCTSIAAYSFVGWENPNNNSNNNKKKHKDNTRSNFKEASFSHTY